MRQRCRINSRRVKYGRCYSQTRATSQLPHCSHTLVRLVNWHTICTRARIVNLHAIRAHAIALCIHYSVFHLEKLLWHFVQKNNKFLYHACVNSVSINFSHAFVNSHFVRIQPETFGLTRVSSHLSSNKILLRL